MPAVVSFVSLHKSPPGPCEKDVTQYYKLIASAVSQTFHSSGTNMSDNGQCFRYCKHIFVLSDLCLILSPSHSSVQMWSRWPLTGSQETSTLWMTWTTGSSCVTRMGRHVSRSWTRSCTTLKASLWTPPWGTFDLPTRCEHAHILEYFLLALL